MGDPLTSLEGGAGVGSGLGKGYKSPPPSSPLIIEVRWRLGARGISTPRGSSPAAAAARSGLRGWNATAGGRRAARITGGSGCLSAGAAERGARGGGPEREETGSGGCGGRPRGARAPDEQAASRSPWSAAGTPGPCSARCSAVCFSQVRRGRCRRPARGWRGQGRSPGGRVRAGSELGGNRGH